MLNRAPARRLPAWEEMPFEDRMEVFNAYLKDCEDNDNWGFGDPGSFEDFDNACRFSTYQYIRRLYIK